MRLVLTTAFAALATGLLAAPASPDSFVVQHDRFTDSSSFTAGSMCPFPVQVTSTAQIDDALFFDSAGNLVRVLETVRHVAVSYSANGNTLTATGTGGFDVHFAPDGTTTVDTFGINLLLTIPHYGSVILDVGRATFVFDPHIHVVFQAGPSQYDLDVVCGALAAGA